METLSDKGNSCGRIWGKYLRLYKNILIFRGSLTESSIMMLAFKRILGENLLKNIIKNFDFSRI